MVNCDTCPRPTAGNQLCVSQACPSQGACPESVKCGSGHGAKLGGEPVYKKYDNFPNEHLPPNPLPADFRFYTGKRCPECVWNALRKDGYVSTFAFDKITQERTPAVFGMLQRNQNRDVRHLFQQAGGSVGCSPHANRYTGPMLEHTASAFDAYPDVPLFGHVHTVAAGAS